MKKQNNLGSKTVSGLLWSFIDLFAGHGIQFVFLLVLARLLAPEYFGIIAIVTIFIIIGNSIVDSGFSQALIREKKVTQEDYSTIFYFNLVMSLVMYILIFVMASLIEAFFNQEGITGVIRVISLSIIFYALSIIQRVILTKNIDFKKQAVVNLLASIGSGAFAALLAIKGYGVWSLVFQTLILRLLQTFLLWMSIKWIPAFVFSIPSFKKYFKFGSRILISGLIDTIYANIFSIIIGKFYPARQLGYFTNASKLSEMISISVTTSLQRVTYPVLSSIQENKDMLKNGFRKIIGMTAYIIFPIMIGLMAVSDSLIVVLFGPNWVESIPYFKLLCLAAILYPLHSLNLNILQVKGRSDLFLKLEIIKKLLLTLLIGASLLFSQGIIGLIGAGVISSYLSFFINTFYSSREISYSTFQQIKDVLPFLGLSVGMGVIVYVIGLLLPVPHFIKLVLQVLAGCSIYIGCSWFFKLKEFHQIYGLLLQLLGRGKKVGIVKGSEVN